MLNPKFKLGKFVLMPDVGNVGCVIENGLGRIGKFSNTRGKLLNCLVIRSITGFAARYGFRCPMFLAFSPNDAIIFSDGTNGLNLPFLIAESEIRDTRSANSRSRALSFAPSVLAA